MKILVINGPNINMLGIREKNIYGAETYEDLKALLEKTFAEKGVEGEIYQSNHEGDLVDRIQQAYFDGTEGIVINPAAYTHTSVAILDALKAVRLPAVEMHICPCDDYEVSWLFGSGLKLTPSNSLFWYNVDDEDNIDEIKKDKNLTWIESEQIIFAWLDKDNQVVPLTDEQLNPVWKILNYETGKYESVQKHFRVFEV